MLVSVIAEVRPLRITHKLLPHNDNAFTTAQPLRILCVSFVLCRVEQEFSWRIVL